MTPMIPEVIGDCALYCGDALEVLKTLPAASVQLIVCDPPYHKVKMDYEGERLDWDRQWRSATDYLHWLHTLAVEWQHA